MDLENRLPDETVNYSDEHPLKEFAWLLVGSVATVVVLVLAAGLFAAEIAARLPYAVEHELVTTHGPASAPPADARLAAAEASLRALGDRLAAAMALEPGMALDIRLVDSPLVNAFATLGGQVRVHRGLVERMPDENALAFVLAHEIAHVKLRHPVRAAGRGVAVGLILAAVGVGTGGPAADIVAGTGSVALLNFSRRQEADADREALAALRALYGHAGGSAQVFELLAASGRSDARRIAMLQTHPLSAERIAAAAAFAASHGWAADGARTPLPPALAKP
jgi:Zn-dependent protease with chaperone function